MVRDVAFLFFTIKWHSWNANKQYLTLGIIYKFFYHDKLSFYQISEYVSKVIDLFTDTAAILNLLDLRSIMGCTEGTRSVFTRAFRAKRELQCIFLGKKAIVITSKDGTTIFFSHYNLFFFFFKEKLARKARVHMYTDASILDRAHALWASHNTP